MTEMRCIRVAIVALALTASVAWAQDEPCDAGEVAVAEQGCEAFQGTRWQIVETAPDGAEMTWLLEIRADRSIVTSHPLGTWPENDSALILEDTIMLTLGRDVRMLRVTESNGEGRIAGESWSPPAPDSPAAIDPGQEAPRSRFRAAPAAEILVAYDTISDAYDQLMGHLHPTSTSSSARVRAIVEHIEDASAQLPEDAACDTLPVALETLTRDKAPGLSRVIADAQGLSAADLEPTPGPGEGSVEESLADAHAAGYARRITSAHKHMHAVVLRCAEEPGVAEAFAGFATRVAPVEESAPDSVDARGKRKKAKGFDLEGGGRSTF